ncbi:large-conductance mechanosensitive channel [Tetragenococcus muriaticus PMC-11-5]|uniref:Large-conductance mechanosensitive channel n=2 Tax=Tetragenococcus muriaticus TaxID=64642 RepID=A0A091CEW9_9ENTE|nr:large-conductance mechanosensitive channel [Tetragenococcus muriaticus 3MR10-3]KFN93791.1 large-conductance mechanosensitive channel [Tetragenococcus muriaticus PMC-11-5]GMA48231.1 large-conductance mechanosensitive channel MscL [Tetragenococcus muriaticus]
MKRIFSEFKEFIIGGDVLDLAVGVVIGSAFTAIVTQVVEGLITPLVGWFVAAITGTRDLESSLSILDWSPTPGVTFQFGEIVSAMITFILTGFILFIIVKAANKAKRTQEEEAAAPVAEDYLAEIRDLLRQEQGLPVETNEETQSEETNESEEQTDSKNTQT